jgi:hypothetical protein
MNARRAIAVAAVLGLAPIIAACGDHAGVVDAVVADPVVGVGVRRGPGTALGRAAGRPRGWA